MSDLYYCKKCAAELHEVAKSQKGFLALIMPDCIETPERYCGFYIADTKRIDGTKCPRCNEELTEIKLEISELADIQRISQNPDYILAMDNLKSKDIIEFETKMENIRQQLNARKEQNIHQKQATEREANQVKCPKCGSTQITTGQRGYSFLTGFLGSNKTVNRCAACGYSWKPGK